MKTRLASSYEIIKNEVATFRDSVLEAITQNPAAKPLYEGCTIMYSGLTEYPAFLFIGINPGAGRFKQTGEKTECDELEPGDGFEYINAIAEEYDYTLARQTRILFQRAGMHDYLYKSVKTNFYYFATSREGGLSDLFDKLGKDMNDQLHRCAFDWTERMIEMIKPKIVICEGIRTLNKVAEIYKGSPTREGSCGYYELPNGTPVVGYSRNGSNIINKPFAANFLRTKCSMRVQPEW